MFAAVARRGWILVRTSAWIRAEPASQVRKLCSGQKGGKNDDDDEEDEDDVAFGTEDFDVEEEESVDVEDVLKALNESEEEITPELASDLVDRMVKGAIEKFDGRPGPENIIQHISPHTISTLRASRITTNFIRASASDVLAHPIEKKVTAEIVIERLGLSRPARHALEILSGPRLKENSIKFACNQYPSVDENRAYIISRIDRLVMAAKIAVGEPVDTSLLETWEDIRNEVERQAHEEIEEAGSVSDVLGETKDQANRNNEAQP